MFICRKLFLFFLILFALQANAQVLDASWRTLVTESEDSFFATDTARMIAENVLLYQRDIGGWAKNLQIHRPLSVSQTAELTELKGNPHDCTIDNGATFLELNYLSRIYRVQPDARYREAFLKGINYLLDAQYKNGGFPQFYPLRKGYYSHITFNDNAMENALTLLKSIADNDGKFSIEADAKTRKRAKIAYRKGIDCILKSQYKQNGVLTSWCAQVDKKTLQPAKARAYELPSLSGKESAGLVLLLMDIENPTKKEKAAINAAVAWFEKTKIEGLRQERYYTAEGVREKRFIEDVNAPLLWARFMELEDNRPFFCDRDGVKKYSMFDIGQERRNGYAWYSSDPGAVLKRYPEWKMKHD